MFDCCLSRRILWTVRIVHGTLEAIRWVSNPCVSKVLIRIRCASSSCGAMVAANTKSADSVGMEDEEDEGEEGEEGGQMGPSHPLDMSASGPVLAVLAIAPSVPPRYKCNLAKPHKPQASPAFLKKVN